MSDFNALHNRAAWFDIPVADPDGEGNRIALHSYSEA